MSKIVDILFKRMLLFLILFTFNSFLLSSQEVQNSSNNWYFGDRAGLDFNTFPPTSLTDGQLDTQEGVASISNSLGELLFYTDGKTVWDRTHQPMPNANGNLNGHFSSSQSAIIVPFQGVANQYYIFTTDEQGGDNGLSYSIVDMTLSGNGTVGSPLGNVVVSQLNIPLVSPVTEKIVGVLKSDNSSYWLIAHGWNNNRFFAYEISCNGITTNPVISEVGNIHTGESINAVGYMKSTIDGQRLALVNRNNNSIDVYDFDKVTGMVSNEIEILPNNILLYGIEFSPNGEFLYIGGTDNISRYSFSTNTLTEIVIDSSTPFSTSSVIRVLQLGPDGNIYVSIRNWEFISIIFNPDGNNPILTTNGIFLDPDNNGRNCRFGLPNIFYFDQTPLETVTIIACPNEQVEFNGEFYQSGTSNEVNLVNALGCDSTIILIIEEVNTVEPETLEFYACDGSFYEFNGMQIPAGSQETFFFTTTNGCDSIITINVNPVDVIETDHEVILCEGETYLFNNEEYPIGTDTLIQFIDQDGCENLFALSVELSPEIAFELIPENACLVNNGSVIVQNVRGGILPIEFSIDGQNYSTDTIVHNLGTNTYNFYVRDSNLCVYDQEFEIITTPELIIEYQEPILSCDDDSLLLRVNLFNFEVSEVDWEWSNGSQNNFTYISEPGIYNLEVSNNCQTISEEISIELEQDLREAFIYIPNAFSPNDDGINDKFKLSLVDNVELINYEIQIFNRWGAQVFQSDDIDFSWDGSFKGEKFNTGVYVWWLKIDAIACKRNINIFKEGDITIFR